MKNSDTLKYLLVKLHESIYKNRAFIFSFILVLGIGVITFDIFRKYNLIGTISKDKLFATFGGISFLITIAIREIVIFLNEDKQKFTRKDEKSSNNDKDEFSFFDKRRIEKEVQKIVSEKINLELSKDEEIVNLEEKITQKISETLSNKIIDDLENRFSENYENENLDENLYDITNNIDFYIDKIQKNSTVNLIIGIFATTVAISILSIEVLSEREFKTVQEFLIHFLPRVTLVVFIQLFAFFFLRLYKNNLEDAKYFQNELTNLTAKTTSIKIASLKKNDDFLFEIVRNLSNTERNFKLSKEETLQTIENKKIETENDKDILAQLKDILSKFEINKTA